MNGLASIEVAAGLTLAAKAVTTGNVAATVEPRAIRSWLMAAPLLVSAPERGGERLEQGAQGTEISCLEQAFDKRSSQRQSRTVAACHSQALVERRARVRENTRPSRGALHGQKNMQTLYVCCVLRL